jgi:hypothetical protein
MQGLRTGKTCILEKAIEQLYGKRVITPIYKGIDQIRE